MVGEVGVRAETTGFTCVRAVRRNLIDMFLQGRAKGQSESFERKFCGARRSLVVVAGLGKSAYERTHGIQC